MTVAQTVLVGSSLVHYRVGGEGEPLILIHGLGGSGACWMRNEDALGRHYRVYVVDLPGFGAMRRYPEPFSVRFAVLWIEKVCSALNLKEVSIVGHSMGALIAATFAARCPGRVKRLVLAAPAIGLRRQKITDYFLPLLRETMRMHPSFYPTLIWDGMRAGLSTSMRASRELLSTNIERELSQISTPCLLLWGELDPLVPVELSLGVQSKIRGSKLRVLKGARHVLMYDHAEEFNRAVLDFLQVDPPVPGLEKTA